MKKVLITGANRGIGLELVRIYSQRGDRVYAACRNPQAAKDLNNLAGDQVSVHALDVTQTSDVKALAEELSGTALDILINNAGIYGPRVEFGSVDYQAWEEVFRVNTMAPLRMAEAFVDHVSAASGVLANISSKVGSITDNGSGGSYMYRSSKSALNMVNKSLSHDLRDRGVTCLVIHPGWVLTDMGGPNALINTQTSANGIVSVIDGSNPSKSGAFFNYDGSEIPW